MLTVNQLQLVGGKTFSPLLLNPFYSENLPPDFLTIVQDLIQPPSPLPCFTKKREENISSQLVLYSNPDIAFFPIILAEQSKFGTDFSYPKWRKET